MRIVTALAGVVGLVAGAMVVASPSVAMVPVEQGGSVVQVEKDQAVPLGTTGESYTAITQYTDDDVFAVRASDETLERIKNSGSEPFDIPSGLETKKIISLSGADLAIAVVTKDGFPHAWGGGSNDFYTAVDGLTTEAALGGDGPAAKATQVAVGVNQLGILLADGRVGVVDGSISGVSVSYRILDLPGTVVQIESLREGTPGNKGLVLLLENGGVVIWKSSSEAPQGTLTYPSFSEMSGADDGPTDKVMRIQTGRTVTVGVTQGGNVYAMNSDGTRASEAVLPPNLPTPDATVQGTPVEAAVLQTAAKPTSPQYLVRTTENKLYVYGASSGTAGREVGAYREQIDLLDLTGKQVVSVTAGISDYQVILADAEPEAVATMTTVSGDESTTTESSVTWDVTVTPASGEDVPTGTVTASADGMDDVTETLDDEGKASLELDGLPVGSHTVTVSYSGADGFEESSATKTLTVTEPEAVATSLTVAGPASTTGASVTWTATVTAESGTPTGQVTATGPGINVSGNLDGSGKASLVLPAGLSVGSHTVTVSYAGDDGFAPAESVTKTLTVSAPPVVKTTPVVTLKVTKKLTKKKAGKATVTVSGGAVATGKVTVTVKGKWKKGKKKAKQKTFTVTGVVKNGVLVVKIKKLKHAKGKWTLAAAYAGDATHNPAVSTPIKVKVKKK